MNEELVQKQEQMRQQTLKETGVVYSVAAALPVFLSLIALIFVAAILGEGYADTEAYKYVSYLVPQISFALVAVFYFVYFKKPAKEVYCGCKWYYFLIAVLLQFGLLFSLSELNNYFVDFLGLFGYTASESTLPSLEGWRLVPAIIVIALLPAVFEETIFRGILSRNLYHSGFSFWGAVLVSGALFSLFHGNPEQTLYQFVCGMCFALVALRSGSVFPTMLAHFLNNAVILVLTALDYESWLSNTAYLVIVILSAVCLVGTLVYLIFFEKVGHEKKQHNQIFVLAAAVGILVCAVEWIVALVSGFGISL